MRLRATTIQHYKGTQNEDLVCTRLEVAWNDVEWLDVSGLRRYEAEEWHLLTGLLVLGCRQADVGFEHRELDQAEKHD